MYIYCTVPARRKQLIKLIAKRHYKVIKEHLKVRTVLKKIIYYRLLGFTKMTSDSDITNQMWAEHCSFQYHRTELQICVMKYHDTSCLSGFYKHIM